MSAVFPSAWKSAFVQHLPKTSNPLSASDLRIVFFLRCPNALKEVFINKSVTIFIPLFSGRFRWGGLNPKAPSKTKQKV